MDVLTCDRCGTSLPLTAAVCSACGSSELTHRVLFDETVPVNFVATATADSRMSFTATFLQSAALSVREAYTLEVIAGTERKDALVIEHKRNVVTAIMLSAAALEAEIFEVLNHGPGHHLGTNGIDAAGKAFLQPLADVVDEQSPLDRYEIVLHLLNKRPINRGHSTWQNAELAIWLRNELVHYKSKWNSQLERSKRVKALALKRHRPPRFVSTSSSFFPEQCLGADCARWCVESLVRFIDAFYENLGVQSPLQPFASAFIFDR
jgi:hypothetical protein